MGRELEIEREDEAVSLTVFQQPKMPYQAVLNGDWPGMASYYEKFPGHLFDYLTVDGDTAFHIAAYSEKTELLTYLLNLVPQDRVFEALSKKNIHGNNIFHEVASTDKVKDAKLLIRKLQTVYGQDKVAGNNMTHLRELLENRNQLGETPLYRAVALGHIKMAKFLAENVEDIRDHFHRNDSMSILHIAVIGQHFETAAWLLGMDSALGTKKGANDMTCLHLLAKMPSAFRSTFRMGKMQTLLYKYLPANYDYDYENNGNGANHETLSSQVDDLESGQGSSTLRQSNKHSSEWPTINYIWKMKKTHASALNLTKMLVKMDTTWADSFKAQENTIFLGRADSLGGDNVDGVEGKGGKGEQPNTINWRK